MAHSQASCLAELAGAPRLSKVALNAIEAAIAASETRQICVWDTELNCGVLIYVQLIDHAVEILADRGIAAHVRKLSGTPSAAPWRRHTTTCQDDAYANKCGRNYPIFNAQSRRNYYSNPTN